MFTARTVLCPDGDPRQIERANDRIRETYGGRFVEVRRTYGRVILPPLRWIVEPGGNGRSRFSSGLGLDLRAERKLGRSDRARARASRERSVPPEARPRRRAVPLPPTPHPGRHVAPYALEPGVLAAIEAHYGPDLGPRVRRAVEADLDSLRRDVYAGRPVETDRAARTLALRPHGREPLAYFRDLFNRACGGDLLCDADEEAKRVRDAEMAAALELGELPDAGDELDGPVEAPDPVEARAAGLRHRLALVGPDHPLAERYRRQLEPLERELAARPPRPRRARRPREVMYRESLTRAEFGPPTGVVREIGGGWRAVVHCGRSDPDAELRARLDALDFDTLDRDVLPERGPG
jgi:hypothetical protein